VTARETADSRPHRRKPNPTKIEAAAIIRHTAQPKRRPSTTRLPAPIIRFSAHSNFPDAAVPSQAEKKRERERKETKGKKKKKKKERTKPNRNKLHNLTFIMLFSQPQNQVS
jgi:hypothetical protein